MRRQSERIFSPLLASPDALISSSGAQVLNAQLHQQMLQVQGGQLFPEVIPVHRMNYVLDLGCGAGEWVFDFAKRYPQLHIYGIDVSEEALHQAKIRRNISSLSQVELRQMDLLKPLPVPDHYVDLVHMRRCASFIPQVLWPHILNECVRMLNTHGWLVLVEIELCEISSAAFQTLWRATLQALTKLGRTMDVSGVTSGVPQYLYSLLLEARLEEVAYDVYTIDLGFMSGSSGSVFLAEFMRQVVLMKPVIIQQGILSATRFRTLLSQASSELQGPDLCGWAIILSIYGKTSAN